MNDLISRQAATEALVAYIKINKAPTHYENQFWVEGMEDAGRIINDLPTAQPEVIRCKDCLMHGVCRFEQGLGLDGYCSQAERRTDE